MEDDRIEECSTQSLMEELPTHQPRFVVRTDLSKLVSLHDVVTGLLLPFHPPRRKGVLPHGLHLLQPPGRQCGAQHDVRREQDQPRQVGQDKGSTFVTCGMLGMYLLKASEPVRLSDFWFSPSLTIIPVSTQQSMLIMDGVDSL